MEEVAPQVAAPVQQQPPERLRKLYDYLKQKGDVKVHDTYEEFKASMNETTRSEKLYDYLKKDPNIKVQPDYATFQSDLGLKKKEDTSSEAPPVDQAPQSQASSVDAQQPSEGSFNEQLDKQNSLAQLSDQWKDIQNQKPLAQLAEQLKTDPTLTDFTSDKSSEQMMAQKQIDQQLSPEMGAKRTVHEVAGDPIQTDSEKADRMDIMKNIGKTAWNLLGHQLPAAAAAVGSILTPDYPIMIGSPGGFAGEPMSKEQTDNYQKGIREAKGAAIKWAEDHSEKGSKLVENTVNTLSKVEDPFDFLIWASNAVTQAGIQIPMAVGTAGGSSFVQEIGSIYLESVKRIADEKQITPEEVITKGLDAPATALAYGTAAGFLDKIGAEKVFKFGRDALGTSLKQRALAALKGGAVETPTEYTQTLLEQVAQEQSTGKGVGESLAGVATDEKRLERLESAAQALVGGAAVPLIMSNIGSKKQAPKLTPQADETPKPKATEKPARKPLVPENKKAESPQKKVQEKPSDAPQERDVNAEISKSLTDVVEAVKEDLKSPAKAEAPADVSVSKAEIKIHEKPSLETPVYSVKIGDKVSYIQRWDAMNSGSEWHEVSKKKGAWISSKFLGFTKEEAINDLKNASNPVLPKPVQDVLQPVQAPSVQSKTTDAPKQPADVSVQPDEVKKPKQHYLAKLKDDLIGSVPEYQNDVRTDATLKILDFASKVYDIPAYSDSEGLSGKYVTWLQNAGPEGYEASWLLNSPRKAIQKLSESAYYKSKISEEIPKPKADAPKATETTPASTTEAANELPVERTQQEQSNTVTEEDVAKKRIETLRAARERWGQLSKKDKAATRQLAENWSMVDLLPSDKPRTTEQAQAILKEVIPAEHKATKVKVRTIDAKTGEQSTEEMEAGKAQILMKKQHNALQKLIDCLSG